LHAHISNELFTFLLELKVNNNRPWFQEHKKRYEQEVKEPLQRFISDFVPYLTSVNTNFVADPRGVGGSLFRIYRDTRYSKDKTPYKTHAGLHFRHRRGKDVHAPGYYLHLDPDECFVGVGIWHPDSKSLKKIREAIVARPEEWTKVVSDPEFCRHFKREGDSLKRGPKGFDPDHPLIDDLKLKDHVAGKAVSPTETTQIDFIDQFADLCQKTAPFMGFLTRALDLEW